MAAPRPRRQRPRESEAGRPIPVHVPGFVPIDAVFPRILPPPDPSHGPPCHFCTALCCTYFALPIETPVTPKEHDDVRWYLLHHNVAVWKQDGDWYLEVRNACRHLRADNSCGIYETRPRICRDYGLPEVEGPCEYFTQDVRYELYFDSAEAFDSWSRAELDRREKRLARRRERRRAAASLVGAGAAEV